MGNLIPKRQQNTLNPNQDEEHQEEEDEQQETFTCEICIEPVTLPNIKFKNSNRCVHPFCTDCMIKYIEAKLENYVPDIKCPASTCPHFLEPLSCRPKIPTQLFIKWCDALCESTVLAVDKTFCPNMECSEMILNECNENKLKRCVCPHCKKPFCLWCKVPWHAGYFCEESEEARDENDVVFGIVCETEGWKRCPMCWHCVELYDGCKNITCRCGIRFCYTCGKRLHQCRCNYSFRETFIVISLNFITSILLAIFVVFILAIVKSLSSHKSFIECFMEIMRELYTEMDWWNEEGVFRS